jgi:hypothetical protein
MTWFLFFCLTFSSSFSLVFSMESDINGTRNTIPDEYSQESLLVNNLDMDLNPLFFHSPFREDGTGRVESEKKEDGNGKVEPEKVLDLNVNQKILVKHFSHNIVHSRNPSSLKNVDNNFYNKLPDPLEKNPIDHQGSNPNEFLNQTIELTQEDAKDNPLNAHQPPICILLENDIYNNPKYFSDHSDHGFNQWKEQSPYQMTEPPEEKNSKGFMKGPTNPIFTIQEDQGEYSESRLGVVELSSAAQNSTAKEESRHGSQEKKPPLSKTCPIVESFNVDDKNINDIWLTPLNLSHGTRSSCKKKPLSTAGESPHNHHPLAHWGFKNNKEISPQNPINCHNNCPMAQDLMEDNQSFGGDGLRCSKASNELFSIKNHGISQRSKDNFSFHANKNHDKNINKDAFDYMPSFHSSLNKNIVNGHQKNTKEPSKPKIFNYLSLTNYKNNLSSLGSGKDVASTNNPRGGVAVHGSLNEKKLTRTSSLANPLNPLKNDKINGKIDSFKNDGMNRLIMEEGQDLDNKYFKYNPTSPVLTDQTMASSGNNKPSSLNKNFHSSMKQSIDMAKNTFNQSIINGIGSPTKPQFYNIPQKFIKESSIYQGTNQSMTSNGHGPLSKKYKKIIGDFKQLKFVKQFSNDGLLAILEEYIHKIHCHMEDTNSTQRHFLSTVIEKIQNIIIALMEKIPRENWSIFFNDINVGPDIHQFKKVQSIINRWQGSIEWPQDLSSIQNNIIIYLYFTLQNKKFLLEFLDEITMQIVSPKQWAQSWDNIFQSTDWIMEYLENMEVEWPPEDMTKSIVKKTNKLGKQLEKLMEKSQNIIDESINSFEQYNDNYENFMELFSEIPWLESQLIKQEFYEQNTDSFLSFTNDKFFPVDRKLHILKKYFYKIRLYVATPEEAINFRFNNIIKFLNQWILQTNSDFSQLKNNYYTEQLMILIEEFLGDVNWILLGFDSLVHMEFLGPNGDKIL